MKKSVLLKMVLIIAALVLVAGPTTVSAQDKPIELTM
ncbi:unnamed protein product, partial [marine sediment metagenome]